jgi:hypothetical protein
MVTRDKDDPRNKKAGEMGPGGVRMVVQADLIYFGAYLLCNRRMKAPGSPMFEELSKKKVGRA